MRLKELCLASSHRGSVRGLGSESQLSTLQHTQDTFPAFTRLAVFPFLGYTKSMPASHLEIASLFQPCLLLQKDHSQLLSQGIKMSQKLERDTGEGKESKSLLCLGHVLAPLLIVGLVCCLEPPQTFFGCASLQYLGRTVVKKNAILKQRTWLS